MRVVSSRPVIVALIAACLVASSTARADSVEYRYDALGRLVEALYDSGVSVRYTYDANGNLIQRVIATGRFPFVLGDRITGALEQPDDEDGFRFHALAGNRITLKVTGTAGLRLRLTSPSGVQLDTGTAKRLAKGEQLKGLLVTEAMLDGAKAGFLSLDVLGDGAVTGNYKLTTREKAGAANKVLRVKSARALDDAIPVQAGTRLSGKIGSKNAPATLADLTVLDAQDAAIDLAGLASESAKKGRVALKSVALDDAGVVRIQSAVATTATLKFKYRRKGQKLTAPDG